jgi:hypothetical protein
MLRISLRFVLMVIISLALSIVDWLRLANISPTFVGAD